MKDPHLSLGSSLSTTLRRFTPTETPDRHACLTAESMMQFVQRKKPKCQQPHVEGLGEVGARLGLAVRPRDRLLDLRTTAHKCISRLPMCICRSAAVRHNLEDINAAQAGPVSKVHAAAHQVAGASARLARVHQDHWAGAMRIPHIYPTHLGGDGGQAVAHALLAAGARQRRRHVSQRHEPWGKSNTVLGNCA